jgi:hypothetical protein
MAFPSLPRQLRRQLARHEQDGGIARHFGLWLIDDRLGDNAVLSVSQALCGLDARFGDDRR